MNKIKKIMIDKEGNGFSIRDLDNDYHSQYGFVKKDDLAKGGLVKTNTGRKFFVFDPTFIDIYRKIKRGAQIIPLKDIGFIVAETGINKKSCVLDAGGGSGALSIFLGNIVKKVFCYEIREDFFKLIEGNIEFLELKNIKLYNKDIYQGIKEKKLDLITLDLPEPWKAVIHAENALKSGGFLISYSPTLPQVSDFVGSVKKCEQLIYLKTVEIILREWEIDERKIRPRSQPIGHSGFMSLCRKV